jgi:hypothetical protein
MLEMVSDQGYSRVFFGHGFVSAAGACEHWGGGADVSCGGSGENMVTEGGCCG